MPSAAAFRSRAAVAATCLAVLAAAAVLLHCRRRRNRAPASPRRFGGRRGRPRRACEEEEKPQSRFKRVLADNSYSAFKHLRRQGIQPGGAGGEAPPTLQEESSQKVHPFEEEITSLLNNPPGFHSFMLECPEMSTSYIWVDTEAQLEDLARLLSKEKAFAVDTEQHSIRSFLGYTALMQISTQKEDYLIDTIALHDAMGILRPVFADPSIYKIFHGSDNDVLWLQRDFHIYVVNMFDTAKACEVLSKPQKSLAYLLEREDWRLRPLTSEMIEYARTDAHYLLYIANCLARMHDESLRYVMSDQAIAALAVSVPKSSGEVLAVIAETDLSTSSTFPSLSSPSPIVVAHVEELCYLLEDTTASMDDIFKTKFEANKIYASDGRLLCYCDRKKLEWYTQRNLAKLIEDSPPAIMLLFEPKGRPEDEDNEFYIQSKKNICVGCGEKSHYIRYRIIPSCYRMHFPEHLKSHRSHDIVLLCVDCHEIAHAAAEKYKRRIAQEFGIPLFVQKIVNSGNISLIADSSESADKLNRTGVSPLQLRTAAMALLRHGSNMPSKRCEELMQIVKSYYGGRDVTPEDLEMALLVGMSPHERKRLEKKKGYSFRTQAQNIIRKSSNVTTLENSVHDSDNNHGLSEPFPEHVTESNGLQEFDEAEIQNQPEGSTLSQGSSSFPVRTDDSALDHNTVTLKIDTDQHASGAHIPANGHVDRDPSICGDTNQAISKNAEKKISLLGHGHHGKQVVELLLSNGGEEAINQFCQRWRQVFVEAVHPRYLPSGWTIKHRTGQACLGLNGFIAVVRIDQAVLEDGISVTSVSTSR
ncbi:hypothetical protein EJB05_12280, partial [Eragrostis curvula]